MDGFSLIVAGTLGILAGWAFSYATTKQHEATRKLEKASKAKEEMTKKKGEAKNNRESSLADTLQGFLLYTLGFCLIFVMGVILFNSII